MLTIDHEGGAYIAFNSLVTICCLVSSFMYLFFAAFRISPEFSYEEHLLEGDQGGIDIHNITTLIICFECIFGLHIIIKFMLTFKRETD